MPRWIKYGLIVLAALALIPPVFIARARMTDSTQPRLHLIFDMDNQPRYKAQQTSPLFADQRVMRPPVPDTVARGELHDDDHLYRGLAGGQFAAAFPMPVTTAMMQRGRERFGIFCAPCHGLDGGGRGMVAVRAEELAEGAWVPPLSVHADEVRGRPVGHLFNTITDGIRTMPAYGAQIPVADRWAIVAYVRALQRSRNAAVEDVPADLRDELR